jgi:hypothetical protein
MPLTFPILTEHGMELVAIDIWIFQQFWTVADTDNITVQCSLVLD